MTQYRTACLLLAALVSAAVAAPTASAAFRVGDCVIFREGGAGLILKSPTYWLRGAVVGISEERRLAALCPDLGKPVSAYTHADWVRLAAALPCVDREVEAGAVEVTRVRLAVDDWETPWSALHGTVGWLFRGQFLEQRLQKGEILEMDANWLEPCQGAS